MRRANSLLTGLISNAGSAIAISVVGFVTGVLIARMLGVEQRGLLGKIFFWGQFLGPLMAFSLSDALVKARSETSDSTASTAASYHIAIGVALLGGIITIALFFGGIFDGNAAFLTLIFCLVQIPVAILDQPNMGVLRSKKSYSTIAFLKFTLPTFYLLALVCCFYIGFEIRNVVFAQCVALCLAVSIRFYCAGANRYILQKGARYGDLFKKSAKLHSVNTATIFSNQLDKLLIVLFATNTVAGACFVGIAYVSVFLAIINTAVAIIVMPHLATLSVAERRIDALTLVRAALFVGAGIGLVVSMSAPVFVPMIFGDDFQGAATWATFLSIAMFHVPAKAIVFEALKALDKTKLANSLLGAYVLVFGFFLVLLAPYGYVFSICGAYLVANFVVIFLGAGYISQKSESSSRLEIFLPPAMADVQKLFSREAQ